MQIIRTKIRRAPIILYAACFLLSGRALGNVFDAAAISGSAGIFEKAVTLLEQSNKTAMESGRVIVDANRIRKEIHRLRAQARKSKDKTIRSQFSQKADTLTSALQDSQVRGSTLRKKSKETYQNSLALFEQGIVEKWGNRVRSRSPIAMDDSATLFMAHNSKYRSVHPNMLNRMGTPTENIALENINTEMSIIVPALADQNAPANLDISSFQLSREQHYLAHIEVKPEKADKDKGRDLVPHNAIHKWVLLLCDLSGEPIKNANIDIVGHMPGHVHGLPTQPRVTKEIAPGMYQLEGIKFQMKGWWVMQFNINSTLTSSQDSVVFNLVL